MFAGGQGMVDVDSGGHCWSASGSRTALLLLPPMPPVPAPRSRCPWRSSSDAWKRRRAAAVIHASAETMPARGRPRQRQDSPRCNDGRDATSDPTRLMNCAGRRTGRGGSQLVGTPDHQLILQPHLVCVADGASSGPRGIDGLPGPAMPNPTQQQNANSYKAQDRQREPSREGKQELPIIVGLMPRLVYRRDPHQREQRKRQPTSGDERAAGKPSRSADADRRTGTKPLRAACHDAHAKPHPDSDRQQHGSCDEGKPHAATVASQRPAGPAERNALATFPVRTQPHLLRCGRFLPPAGGWAGSWPGTPASAPPTACSGCWPPPTGSRWRRRTRPATGAHTTTVARAGTA